MGPRSLLLPLLLVTSLWWRQVGGDTTPSPLASPAADVPLTFLGCPCVSACGLGWGGTEWSNLHLRAWCYTSLPNEVPPANTTLCMVSFDAASHRYWDFCVVTVVPGGPPRTQLHTFTDLVTAMVVSSVVTCSALYCVGGCIASALTSPRRTALWLPLAAMLAGACQGVCVGAPFAVILSFLFLSIPYAVDVEVAVAIGCAIALLVGYWGVGRHYKRADAPHPAELYGGG